MLLGDPIGPPGSVAVHVVLTRLPDAHSWQWEARVDGGWLNASISPAKLAISDTTRSDMAPTRAPGEPRVAPKPEPLGNIALIILCTTCTVCVLFILWRRASTIKTVVAHQLQTWTNRDGAIRLSIDDGPPAREFLDEDYDEDNEAIGDEEPLSLRAERLKAKARAKRTPSRSPSPSVPHSTLPDTPLTSSS